MLLNTKALRNEIDLGTGKMSICGVVKGKECTAEFKLWI